MSVLADNVFMNSRYEQYEDYDTTQSYYDLRTGIIYIVMEEYGMKGSTIIQEITEDSPEYKANYERYRETFTKDYHVTLKCSAEYRIEAHTEEEAEAIARDKFGCNYLIDKVEIEEV